MIRGVTLRHSVLVFYLYQGSSKYKIFPPTRLVDRVRTAVNVLGDAFGAAIVAHLSRKELAVAGTEMEQMDKLDVERSKLMEIVKFDEEREEEKTLLVTEDTKATVIIADHEYHLTMRDNLTYS